MAINLYSRDPVDVQRMRPPFLDVVAVDVSSTDQTFSGIRVCRIQSKTAGTVKLDTPNSTGVSVPLAAGFPADLRVTKIYHTGTDAGLQSGQITVQGFTDDTAA